MKNIRFHFIFFLTIMIMGCASPIKQVANVYREEAPPLIEESSSYQTLLGPQLLGCSSENAQKDFLNGFNLEKEQKAKEALQAFKACLKKDKHCQGCQYEMGWSLWTLEKWGKVIESWSQLLKEKKLDPYYKNKIHQYLPVAQENLKLNQMGYKVTPDVIHPKIGSKSIPQRSPVRLTLLAKFQNYSKESEAFDPEIDSPKSVAIHPNGKKVYVSSLENGFTLVYDGKKLKKLKSIRHSYDENNQNLFINANDSETPEDPKKFFGKPVESAFSHNGKLLWVAYYRKDFDAFSKKNSAVAIIDTEKDELIGAFHTGPISKYVLASHDGRWLAVSNWGNNTVSLLDISAPEAKDFKLVETLVVEKVLDLTHVSANRDSDCGFCLRGLAFTKDNRYLLVGRMSGGAIAVFELPHSENELQETKYLGSIFGLAPSTRDLISEPSGKNLLISCNSTGYLVRVSMEGILQMLKQKKFEPTDKELPREKVFMGLGARTIRLSADSRYVYGVTKLRSELVVVDLSKMKVIARSKVDSFPVGLDVSADDKMLWTTAQSQNGKGGNALDVFKIQTK